MERTEILNDSNTFLDSNGTLAVVVSIKEDRTHFVPNNPCYKMITEKFNDETTSDVSFEVVLDFIAENSVEASQKIPFSDIPGHLIRDILVAFGRSQQRDDANEEDSDQFSVMRVSDLRRMLDEKGLDVDGSREAMTEALKDSAEEAN
eukprot:scaffold5887_cov104-Skeletonema_marinoi.AAC.3